MWFSGIDENFSKSFYYLVFCLSIYWNYRLYPVRASTTAMPRVSYCSMDAPTPVALRSAALKVTLVPLKKRAYMRESWKRSLLHTPSKIDASDLDQPDVHTHYSHPVSSSFDVQSSLQSRSRSHSSSHFPRNSLPPHFIHSDTSLRPSHVSKFSSCFHSGRPISTTPVGINRKHVDQEGSVHSVSRSHSKNSYGASSVLPYCGVVTRRRAKVLSMSHSLIPPGTSKYHTIHS